MCNAAEFLDVIFHAEAPGNRTQASLRRERHRKNDTGMGSTGRRVTLGTPVVRDGAELTLGDPSDP